MKKILLFVLLLVMSFTLVACGGETNTSGNSEGLVDVTTEQGISFKLPSDMTSQIIQGNQLYTNTETGDSVVVKVVEDSEDPFSEWTEATTLAIYQSAYPDAVIQSFENGIEINGNESLVAMVDFTTPEGNDVTLVLVFINGGTLNYLVNYIYRRDNIDTSLELNIQTCIESITIIE